MEFPVGKRISVKTGEVLSGSLFTEADRKAARERALSNDTYRDLLEDELWDELLDSDGVPRGRKRRDLPGR